MLQITGNTVQERFLSAVRELKIKFPGRTIADKTGYKKATISEYLKKKPPSEAFIRTFSEKFEVNFDAIWKGENKQEDRGEPIEQDSLSLNQLAKALADQALASKIQAEANKENAEAMNKLASAIQNISLNFGTILSTQDAGFGLVAELVNRQVHKDAKGNAEKAKSDLDEIAQRIGPGLGLIARKGIGADAHNDDMRIP